MKDAQVDLCGQINYEVEETFPLLQKEETFSFACAGCGDCCRGREDIVLSGYDLFRIAAYLHLPTDVVVGAVCRHYVGKNSFMPVVRLQPLKNEQANCPFLHQSGCAIHTAKPLVCALYPLGQQIELDGTVHYFAQTVHCGGQVFQATLDDFLSRYQIGARETFDVQWAFCCITIARKMKRLAAQLSKAQFAAAQQRIYQMLYINYDTKADYAPQFEKNTQQLLQYLARIEAVSTQKAQNIG